MSTARNLAIAAENDSIEASQARAIAARQAKPRTALEAMASRLQMSPSNLMNTLKQTVFKECRNDSEFAALVVVANEYGLNPLLKEIYAFPAKGGGVVPMVGVDGWVRLMNQHPQFDGIEFVYHNDGAGKTEAIEAVIHRKDRSHPIKVIEYMDECKGNTIPWTKSARRMLRHRSLIQGVRIAFGFSGIASDGDEDVIDGGLIYSKETPSLPSKQSLAEELNDEIPAFDRETGEVIETNATGMTEVSEEAARELDAGEGRATEDMGEAHSGAEEAEPEQAADDTPAWAETVTKIKGQIGTAKNVSYLKATESEYLKHAVMLPQEVANEIEALLAAKKREMSAEAGA